MDNEEIDVEWINNKRNFLCTMLKRAFEERSVEYLKTAEFSSMEELDAWAEEELTQFEEERKMVREYYNEMIGS